MTDLELRIEVAKAMGYHVWWDEGDYEYPFMWLPLKGEYVSIPDWPEDLSACMRDLWPWLKQQGTEMALESNCDQTAWSVSVVPHPRANWAKSETLALCHAVLAVAEELKEQSNAPKR